MNGLFRPIMKPLPDDTGSDRAAKQARDHRASMSAERRAQLDREWSDPTFVFDAFKSRRDEEAA